MSDFSHLTPFIVNEQVLAAIRPMELRDCHTVALLHQAAMGKSLWAQLGLSFLEALYRELIASPCFIAYVYEEDGQIGGFIAGTTDSANLFSSTLIKGWRRLVIPILTGILRHPRLIWQLLFTATYFSRSRSEDDDVRAESLFCSFRPNLRGTRISGHINMVLFKHLLHLGFPKVKVTTEIDNQGANRQLRSWGFREVKHFEFYGKKMVTYILDLVDHPRLK